MSVDDIIDLRDDSASGTNIEPALLRAALDKLLESIELIKYFTGRVEKGSIQSVTTYSKYKDFLNTFN